MLNFIYIAEEKKDFELSGGGIIKVGYTKDVKRRSGQMKQAARRTLHEELNITITRGKKPTTAITPPMTPLMSSAYSRGLAFSNREPSAP